jgi:hypothetical protein
VTIFPSVFRDYGKNVEKDRVVILKGRISSRERVMEDDEGGTRNVELLADEIRLLSGGILVGNGGPQALNVQLDRSKRDVLHLVRGAIDEYRGNSEIYFHVHDGTRTRRLVCNLKVDPGDLLRTTLERLLGKQSIWLG